MDFRPYIVVVKQPVKHSVTYEISTDQKSITIHDQERKGEPEKKTPQIRSTIDSMGSIPTSGDRVSDGSRHKREVPPHTLVHIEKI